MAPPPGGQNGTVTQHANALQTDLPQIRPPGRPYPVRPPDAATPPHPDDKFSHGRQTLKSVPFLGILSPDAQSREANNLLGNGFLRREQTGLINGPTGIGKSVFLSQAAVCWAVGRPYFGIRPQHALRILIVQSENDDEDMAEMRDGILAGLDLTPTELQLAKANIRLMRCFSAGAEFLLEITPDVIAFKPDILLVDPLFAYVGVDIAKDQPGLTRFLRTQLLPFTIHHRLGVIFAHHTNKPAAGKNKTGYSAGDNAYAGSGHNELANFARFVASLHSLRSRSVFQFQIGKRSKRAGIVDRDGKVVHSMLIKHSAESICWEPATQADLDASIEHAPKASSQPATASGPSKQVQFATAFAAVQKDDRATLAALAAAYGCSDKSIRRLFDEKKELTAGDERYHLADSVVTLVRNVGMAKRDAA